MRGFAGLLVAASGCAREAHQLRACGGGSRPPLAAHARAVCMLVVMIVPSRGSWSAAAAGCGGPGLARRLRCVGLGVEVGQAPHQSHVRVNAYRLSPQAALQGLIYLLRVLTVVGMGVGAGGGSELR